MIRNAPPLKKEKRKKENKFRKEDSRMPRDVHFFLEYKYKKNKNNDNSKTLRSLEVEEPNKSVAVSDTQRNNFWWLCLIFKNIDFRFS